MADPARSLCVHRKTGPSRMVTHCEALHCISQHWDFNALTSNLWIPLFPKSEEDIQWWTSAHNVLRVAPVTPTKPDPQFFTDALNIGWGPHWNALTVSGVWTTTQKTLHINMLDLEDIQRAMRHWLRKFMGLTAEQRQYSCTDRPRGYSSCVRTSTPGDKTFLQTSCRALPRCQVQIGLCTHMSSEH